MAARQVSRGFMSNFQNMLVIAMTALALLVAVYLAIDHMQDDQHTCNTLNTQPITGKDA